MKITIQKSPFVNKNGLTIKELKIMINDTPEVNEDGKPFEVWVQTGDNVSSPVKTVYKLNSREDGCDILLSYE